MKGSAVSQSFKVLASKINNQAPLGQRESSRLLNALTSSFRKHLDEAHPSQSHEDSKRLSLGKAGSEASHQHAFASSITLADQHMASVLTNPLLVRTAGSRAHPKPELDASTAAAELKDGANPFDLLERYHAKGHATVDVALSCMKTFRRSIKDLTYEEQVAKVQEAEAGKRVLGWLWNSDVLQSQAFADSLQIQDGLVWLVMMEGHEAFLWDWLDSDLELPQLSLYKGQQDTGNNHFWKSRIIYAMVMTNLGPPHKGARSADAALEVYFRAVQHVQQRKNAGVRDRMLLVSRARLALEKALTHGSQHHYSNTNPALYDKFVKIYADHQLSHTYNAQKYALDEFHRAQLDLWHPARPSADIWYDLLTREIPASDGVTAVRDLLQVPKSGSDTAHYLKTFARAARLMKIAGKHSESARLVAAAQSYYPDKISQVTEAMHGLLADEYHYERHDKKAAKEKHEHQHQHNWLSHYFPAPT